MPTDYENLTDRYNDIFTVPYPHPLTSEETAEKYMKDLINDHKRCDEMNLSAMHVRLKNVVTGQADNRTFMLSLADDNGDELSKKPRRMHRYDENGELYTVGLRTSHQKEIGCTFFKCLFWVTPVLYESSHTQCTPLKPRQENRMKVHTDRSLFHPNQLPNEGQIRYTFSHTNNFSRSLVKRDLIDNATTFKATPKTKAFVELHGIASDYTGKLLRIITSSADGDLTIHYFKCTQNGKHNHWHVQLDEQTILKNWTPKKHIPIVKKYLQI